MCCLSWILFLPLTKKIKDITTCRGNGTRQVVRDKDDEKGQEKRRAKGVIENVRKILFIFTDINLHVRAITLRSIEALYGLR